MDRPWYKNYVEGTPKEITIPEGPLWTALDDAVKKYPDNEALFFEGVKVTYRELGELVDRAANGFAKMGVKKGDRVAIVMPNSVAFVTSFYAILKAVVVDG